VSLEPIPLDGNGSFAWLAHPEEPLERASCALALAGGVVLVDPVDAPGLDEAVGEVGKPLGVVTLLDRHQRDAASVAARLDVPRLLPRALGGPGLGLEGVEERTVVRGRFWQEALLWLESRRLLVCVEAIGSGRFYLAHADDRLGVHPVARLLRLRRAFAGIEPETIAVGHGRPLRSEAASELRRVLDRKLADLPRAWARAARLGWQLRGRL
jgi:hypothetical protein